MKRLLSFMAALSLVFAAAGWGLTPVRAQGHGADPGPTGEFSDQDFLRMMIMHHHLAVLMAEPLQTRAVHPEVAQLATNIVNDQTAEIARMQGWLRGWYGMEMPPLDHGLSMPGMAPAQMPMPAMMPMPGQMSMPAMMTAMDPAMMDMMMHMKMEEMLKLPDERLEVSFMMMMVEHHQQAIDMAQMASAQATHAEVRQLAQDIIAAQSAEIRQLNQWLALWFNL